MLAFSMSPVIKTSGTCHLICSCVLDASGCGMGDAAGALGGVCMCLFILWIIT